MGNSAAAITLLGRVSLGSADDRSETSIGRGRRAELVFAYLAAEHRRVVTQSELADALWPDGLPDTWEAALRGVLTEVRRFLAEGGLDPGQVLTTVRRGHRMDLPSGATVDLDEARDALASARSHLANGDAAAAAEDAARSSALARLPFLPNHEGEWVDGIRRELESTAARALETEARAWAAAGDIPAAAGVAERWVEVEPFNEVAHQLRIRLLGRAGDRSGALRAYEHCRALLAEELGVEPADETVSALRSATEREVATPVPRQAQPAPTPTGSLMPDLGVLVVEDHDFQRRTAVMLVRSLGVTDIADAADGHAALAMLEASPAPDVILCDIDLPGMDGVEFIRHVAERGLAGAVIIASALDTKVVQAVRAVSEGYGLQVLGAIEKPLRARRLAELLADYRPRPRPSEQASPDAADLTKEARTALDDGRITIHFQPEIDIGTGQVLTARSRPRWHDPARGWVPPDAFLPVLGGEGLLPELFALELASACAQVVDYGAQGLDLSIAVAVPGESLGVTDFADLAAATAQAHGADPSRITFWVDERSLTHAPSAALGVLTRLRVKGFGLSLGNFRGGGALNELLRALPFTEASIAPVLVTGAAGSPPRVRDLEETVEAGRALAPTVAGEGCDSEADLQLLLALGCDRVQGGYIQDPVPGEELPGWISRWDPERLEVGGAA